MKKLIDFLSDCKIEFEENVLGSKLTSFRIGGSVRLVAKPKNPLQIKGLFDFLKENNIKNVLLGRGSNIVISDEGFDGVAILLSEMNSLTVSENRIIAEAGVSMLSLATFAQKNGLSGLEFTHGIPGSVGGGVYMNAGAYGGEMCQVVLSCECYDKKNGKFVHLENIDCAFEYRHSIFQENKDLVLLSATFGLNRGDSDSIRSEMDCLRAKRIEKQPLEYPSAGSTFKRPLNNFAGKLIEDCGLKGYTIGGAQVSEKHAGFVINRGNATADDVKKLVEYIKNEVNKKFGVLLECEIEFI